MINLSPDTEALAQRLATAQRLSPEDAIRLALEDRARRFGLARERRPRKDLSEEAVQARLARMNKLVEEIKALPILDARPIEDIVNDLNAL
jgi:hypothetical protein